VSSPALIAYSVTPSASLDLVPASRDRDWISATHRQFARRCLPLLMANQAGWALLSRHRVRLTWNGGHRLADTTVEPLEGDGPAPVKSHFGYGIVTWNVPFVFRTPPGWNLLARGPANWPKDGIAPLEGLVETDWATATFTMNWKLTRPGHPVEFTVGEPVAMLVPQPRGALERFEPSMRALEEDEATAAGHRSWAASRARFNADLRVPGSAATARGWQRDYFRGRNANGTQAPVHQTRLSLRPFSKPQGADYGS
jgi:antitoxin (DNA-binding transcriptional repressor) of toxin-antitoxin stability system